MTRGFVPQRDENGDEDRSVVRVDLDVEVPDHVLDDAPSWRAAAPRRYARYPGVEGRDIVDVLVGNGVPVGAHDVTTAVRIARDLDSATMLTLLSWVRRARDARPG
ncbi:hypothetical protein AB2L27_02125 [Kineococcus sp. LSe6-4]|uniref:Uncharacterized protein n=1 Tax=Kineococcus halophytocola TaxID=3234027 RepID=A0ABV4GW70_9ACTN